MSLLRLTALCAALVGVAHAADPQGRLSNDEWKAKRAGEEAKAADDAAAAGKRSAVDKVVALLEGLQKQVMKEGEEEAAAYNKFACFCKTDQKNKKEAIQKETDAKESLTADINKLSSDRVTDDNSIETLEGEISDLDKDMEAANLLNKKGLKAYGIEEADLSKAIDGITNAMQVLKASKPALLQLKAVSATVREAMAMADAMGFRVEGAAFLQSSEEPPEVEMENYKFHSGSVIKTLESLLAQFRTTKAESDADEVKRLTAHDMLMQEKTDMKKAKTVELTDTQKSRDDKIAEIADKSQKLSLESANLLDDQAYLKELYRTCSNKAETWDKRSKVRADEISAIAAAATIIKDVVHEKVSSSTLRLAQSGVSVRLAEAVAHNDLAMEAVEQETEEQEAKSPMSFLQVRSVPEEAVSRISALLLKSAGTTKSTLLAGLATELTTGKPKGMDKVKVLIEELIKRLEAEAANEATQKGWCDKSMSEATTKRVSLTNAINEDNDAMAKLEADRRLLKAILATLEQDIQDLKDAQTKADDLRKDEKTENEATVKEANEGKTAVEEAIKLLKDFYEDAAKTEAKSMLQEAPKIDAPDAGFKEDEEYDGAQSGATGVLGMLDVILSDFDRTVKETEQAELEAGNDHTAFTTTTQATIKEKEDIEKARKTEKSDADAEFDIKKASLKSSTERLVSTVEELLELQKTCVDTAMSYAERVARREEEIASLRKALCILSKSANYGATPAEYDQC